MMDNIDILGADQGLDTTTVAWHQHRARGLLATEFMRCCEDLSDPDSALFGCATASAVADCA